DLPELLLVDDGANVARFIERIAELEHLHLFAQRIQERVENVAVKEQARSGGAGLALSREAHGGNDAIDNPILVRIREYDRGDLAAKLKRNRHDAVGGRAHD